MEAAQKTENRPPDTASSSDMDSSLGDRNFRNVWLLMLRQSVPSWIPVVLDDNQGAVAVARNPIHHNALKHIEVRFDFIWECVTSGKLSLEKVSMADNIANGMTKGLLANWFRSLREMMGVKRT